MLLPDVLEDAIEHQGKSYKCLPPDAGGEAVWLKYWYLLCIIDVYTLCKRFAEVRCEGENCQMGQ